MPTRSVAKNAAKSKVVFVDSEGTPVNPTETDGVAVTWTVYGQDHSTVRFQAEQSLADAVAAGTFEYVFVPVIVETVSVEAIAMVEGLQQVGRTEHRVVWTERT